ncbi:MAG: phosphatidylserine decarboxylase family protein [Flavobacteriales bacterium]|nr:phosphatidylserine decarboxylase family protein [Flavobacteriales bacterium]|tara:strand:+ start:518 stop:1165 length:648 start_codon:yes stop_codon:yes gene_type:complete
MTLHKEGIKILRNEIIIFTILNYLFYIYTPIYLAYFITVFTTFLFIMSVYFFRIPNRKLERKDRTVYSPCDGKVVIIEEVDEPEFYKDRRIQVSIFMSPLNVHNQLYPISGKVEYTKYHPGKYLVAWHPKSSLLNERSTVVVKNENISVLFRQIAGAVARRIITYCKVGDTATSSDEYGFIKFGSRVDVFLPLGTKIDIRLNEVVKAGQSIIAEY